MLFVPLPHPTGISETQTLANTKGERGELGWTFSPCPEFLNALEQLSYLADSLPARGGASSCLYLSLVKRGKDMVGCTA